MTTAPILGLHHVTATVSDAQADLDFAHGSLGLRLVKKTVNFDNRGVYHFYYGDERGTPGTLWTTFPYRGMNVRVGGKGEGQITTTSFSVPESSLPFWAVRFRDRGIPVQDSVRFGEASLLVRDPSGLSVELVGTSRDAREPWTGGGVPADAAVRGLHGVTLTVRDASPTVAFIRRLFPAEVVADVQLGAKGTKGRVRLAVGGDGPGHFIDINHADGVSQAQNGIGTVHHVAFAIADADAQRRLREELLQQEVRVTPLMDRHYFQSIYFREPGGVLFEVATITPGFLVDEALGELGRGLKLPPWEEPHRAAIAASLPTIHY
jgi:glyoxalase family protein